MLSFYLSAIYTSEDKTKFEQLYKQYSRLMLYIANSILCDDYLAQDAVHTAFIKIISNLHKIDDVYSNRTKSFLAIIVKNVAIQMYTKQKKNKVLSFNDMEYDLSDSGGLEKLISKLSIEEIVSEIRSLPEVDSEILMLRYIYELNDKEIASLLNIKKPTARKRLERARQRLSARLKKADG